MTQDINCKFGEEFAPWQTGAAFNAYQTYTFINNSTFYSLIPAYYRPFMQRFVQVWLQWYDGWVPYFHNQDKGVLSTRLATSLVNRIARKVIGSRLMYKNSGKVEDSKGSNASRTFICDWSERTGFESTVKQSLRFAGAAGTSLLKLNKNAEGELWGEAVRFDRFLPTVDAGTGKVQEIKCFLMTVVEETTKEYAQAYNLVERRYFGDYKSLDGTIKKNVPLVEYGVYRVSGSITQGAFTMSNANGGMGERRSWKELPKNVSMSIFRNYGKILLDTPSVLPFANSLGCELICWTPGVSGLPGLPFGESILATIQPFLQEYDIWASYLGTDMYIARGRVLAPEGIQGVSDARGIAPSFNAGLDSMIYTRIPYVDPENQKPIPIQFELRSAEWEKIRNMLIESIAVHIGVSPATIAAFLNDSSARTAREVSTEENETANYVADTRAIVETPINSILDSVRLYYGKPDKVVLRWSQSGLSNPYMMTEMMTAQYGAGLVSLKDAITNLNPDDDEDQIEYKVIAAQADADKKNSIGNAIYNDSENKVGYFGEEVLDDNKDIKPTGDNN